MFGTYGWNAGATQAHIFADLAALVCGAAVGDLSASCNKAASNVAGEASGWSVLDADSYVIARAGQAGGPGMQAQFGAQASQHVGVRAVEASGCWCRQRVAVRVSSSGSFEMWASIAAARVLREVELAEAMTPEARAVWLGAKREKLAKEARNRISAAAKIGPGSISDALIADASFALAKWAHY